MLPQLRLLPSCLNGCNPGTASRKLLRVLYLQSAACTQDLKA